MPSGAGGVQVNDALVAGAAEPQRNIVLRGDEFAVLIHEPLFEEKLVAELDRFLQQVQQIPYGDFKISCCIGVVPLTFPQSVQHLYQKADQYLYYAKSRGRGQYFIGRAAK